MNLSCSRSFPLQPKCALAIKKGMEITYQNTRIALKQGDITQEEVDAIVNAANRSLLGGGGVDGAIHRAGGPSILAECRKIGGCQTGQAAITGGGNLKATYVIHTVGPVWHGGSANEEQLLRNAYQNSLREADENGVKSIAFPSISTGAYSYPIDQAAHVALKAVRDSLDEHSHVQEVRFVLYSQSDLQIYQKALQDVFPS